MSSSISGSQSSMVPQYLIDGAERRQRAAEQAGRNQLEGERVAAERADIGQELTEIGDLISKYVQDRQYRHRDDNVDEMTQQIGGWQRQFSQLNQSNGDVRRVLSEHIQLMQEILVDCLSHTPLDEDAVLGSDGRTYGSMTLRLYLSTVPEPLRNRSPSFPESTDRFTASAHPVVKHMLRWLEKHNARLHSADTEAAFKRASERWELPNIPSEPAVQSARDRILARQAERNRVREEEQKKFAEDVIGLSRDVQQEREAGFREVHARIDEVSQKANADIDEVQRQHDVQIANIQALIAQREQEIAEGERHNQELRERVSQTNVQISAAERDNLQIEIAMNETRQALKKRDKGWLKDLLTVVAIIGVCAFATWALQGALAAAGSTATATAAPTMSGGGRIGVSFAF